MNWPSSSGRGGFFLSINPIKGTEMPSTAKDNGSDHEQPVPDDTIMKITKEIAIKFIEMGRLTPTTFDQVFKSIHTTVKETAKK